MSLTPHLLEVENLTVTFGLRSGDLTAIDGVSFTLDKGERLGLVGESGAGKSVTGFAIINLISKPGAITGGCIRFQGRDLAGLSEEAIRDIRGHRISMIFQDPMMTLNPVLTIGTQMVETLQAHRRISKREAEALALEKLRKVYISSPEKRLAQYPHEFSGGMRQRIVIAIALLSDPLLIIADEPTTALDVTIQAEIMDLLQELCTTQAMGLILITHDLGVVSQVTERIAVMYAGRIIETGPTDDIIRQPQHPYTMGLIRALPGSLAPGEPLHQIPGMMPNLTSIPVGCAFHPRCPFTAVACSRRRPELITAREPRRQSACHMVAAEAGIDIGEPLPGGRWPVAASAGGDNHGF
ncbi:MAG: ABC transporter ATP-binding protein [Pseudomonadota bacterium]